MCMKRRALPLLQSVEYRSSGKPRLVGPWLLPFLPKHENLGETSALHRRVICREMWLWMAHWGLKPFRRLSKHPQTLRF